MKKKRMDLNRETAMRLWNKFFGKETKVKDFTGRMIAKGAYNDRKSEFGWNVDHILPQSKGGKTADYNLVVCHILTNDEKADKFPSFKANEINYQIVRVENHYEIQKIGKKTKKIKEEDDSKVNFYDSASGIRFFKSLKGIQNKPRFVGSILIRLENVQNTAVIDFIEKFLDEENISYSMSDNFWNTETKIIAKNYNMPLKEDISKLLDKCILLNTYLSRYFKEMNHISHYEIRYRIDYYQEKQQMYVESQNIRFDNYYSSAISDSLYINNLVYINSEANEKEPGMEFSPFREYLQYDYVFTKLAKNLEKEVAEN